MKVYDSADPAHRFPWAALTLHVAFIGGVVAAVWWWIT